MERSEILATMAELKLYGMKAAFDEIITTAVKRQHEPQRVVGDLLTAEITEKQARSIKYQITIAKLPLAKDIDDGSCWVPGWWIVSSNNRRHEGAKQGLAALTGVVHELKETKIQRQLVLRDTPVRPQPGAQQRPEALNCIDMNFAQSIAIIVARILAMGVADRLVAVAPGWQPGVDVVFISVDQRAGCNRLRDDRLDGCLLHVGQHMQDDAPAALDQAKDWRFLLFQRAASRRACKPATTSRAPLFTTSAGWPLCPATM